MHHFCLLTDIMACAPCKPASKKPPAPVPAASKATDKVVDANTTDGAAAAVPDTLSAQPDAVDTLVLPDKVTDEAWSQQSEASSDHTDGDDELPDKSESPEPVEQPQLQSPSPPFCPLRNAKGNLKGLWHSPHTGIHMPQLVGWYHYIFVFYIAAVVVVVVVVVVVGI
jgi:hypothetical protein